MLAEALSNFLTLIGIFHLGSRPTHVHVHLLSLKFHLEIVTAQPQLKLGDHIMGWTTPPNPHHPHMKLCAVVVQLSD